MRKRNALFIHQDPPNASHFHFGLKMLVVIELGNRPEVVALAWNLKRHSLLMEIQSGTKSSMIEMRSEDLEIGRLGGNDKFCNSRNSV